ncbi:carboxymuconolactone decarboxylase family protein [Nocardiopsis eucommiae]|uniref:Carboxymuconolactone decarboxylase family protein n=1 Tax=Nocardiopsis eucommiae TaxID=2831970 RepID=A0A975LBC2_9ACTN|nr:carboxymuconolactone decarboxylase family protein [Nocardiopsis eucommiae]
MRPVPPRAARGGTAALYRQLEGDFGVLAPPIALLTPAPECAAATWVALRESLLVDGRTSRAAREAVATAVSRDNSCPYCVEVHGATLDSLAPDVGTHDQRVRSTGDPVERAELGAVTLTFEHINRLVNVFLPDSPLPDFAPAPVRGPLRRATGAVIAGDRGSAVPGTSLELLPDTARRSPVPDDLRWAAGSPGSSGPWPPPSPRSSRPAPACFPARSGAWSAGTSPNTERGRPGSAPPGRRRRSETFPPPIAPSAV